MSELDLQLAQTRIQKISLIVLLIVISASIGLVLVYMMPNVSFLPFGAISVDTELTQKNDTSFDTGFDIKYTEVEISDLKAIITVDTEEGFEQKSISLPVESTEYSSSVGMFYYYGFFVDQTEYRSGGNGHVSIRTNNPVEFLSICLHHQSSENNVCVEYDRSSSQQNDRLYSYSN